MEINPHDGHESRPRISGDTAPCQDAAVHSPSADLQRILAKRASARAGQLAAPSSLIDVGKLVSAFYTGVPDERIPSQRVAFGTSGHRGSAFDMSFNEWHVVAIAQAICNYRRASNIDGPLFLGIDTHALSHPASASALEVLAANGVDVMLSAGSEYTPTPAVSLAIVTYNRARSHPGEGGLADGIVMTPSHNPPRDGGFKYNPPHGGPAARDVTAWIETEANRLMAARLDGVKRIPHAEALRAATTHRHDFLDAYVGDLGNVIDMDVIRDRKVRIGVDPLGGAGVHYWSAIADRYGIDLTVVSETVDPTFGFMPLDRDGVIRMDPSSAHAMQRLIGLKDRFDIAIACDADHDRHGIVTPGAGLMAPDHYLAAAIDFLFRHRPRWAPSAVVGKTVVSSRLIDRLTARLGRRLFDAPVGFKWFADGLQSGALGFAGEESAGATFLRRDGSTWTTDKDGIAAALLAAEITARSGSDPGERYAVLADEFGSPVACRIESPATAQQKLQLAALDPMQITATELAGEGIESILTHAPGNGEPIGGIKINAANGWFAARPSGTENIYKIYAESFLCEDHLARILREAQVIVDAAISPHGTGSTRP